MVAIADCYDAMTSDRSYRKALPHDVSVSVSELERCAGAQFDPELVPTFVKALEEHRDEAKKQGLTVPR